MEVLKVERIDHHGIVAGTIRELGLVDLINDRVGRFDDEKISAGEAVAGMIINGLGFSDRPLTLTPQFFDNCPIESLFREGIVPDDFNRFKLGRVLERASNYGCDLLFGELARHVVDKIGINCKFGHLDTTRFSLTGEYLPDGDEHGVLATYGYSKDCRPDLKQVVLEMMVSQDGGIPLIAKGWDGNSSDNTIFSQRSASLENNLKKSVWPEILVADSKLYSENNAKNLAKITFITRVPNTISAVVSCIEQAVTSQDAWQACSDERKYQTSDVTHYGINARWIVVHSQQAEERATKTLRKKVEKERESIDKQLFHLQAQRFSCEEDALKALTDKTKKWKYHPLEEFDIKTQSHYDSKGRPFKDAKPLSIDYQIEAKAKENSATIKGEEFKLGCYVVATNASKDLLSD